MHVHVQFMCNYDMGLPGKSHCISKSENDLLNLPKYPQQFFLPALVPTLLIHIKHVYNKITLSNMIHIFTKPLCKQD